MIETDIMVDTTMKLTCGREEFVSRLGIISRAVSTRSSVQILAGVLLEAAGGELRLAATDMELSLRTSLDAQVESDGSFVDAQQQGKCCSTALALLALLEDLRCLEAR